MNKNNIRKETCLKREAMNLEEVILKSKEIKTILFNCDKFKQAKSILFYASYRNEVDTSGMISESLDSKIVLLPRIDNGNLRVCRINSLNELNCNKYGIMEPKNTLEYSSKIDLVIVPGVAFDSRGYRIGFGKGYYDRLLPKIKAENIGLAFKFQVVDFIPYGDYDVPVDMLITEQGIISCIRERQKGL